MINSQFCDYRYFGCLRVLKQSRNRRESDRGGRRWLVMRSLIGNAKLTKLAWNPVQIVPRESRARSLALSGSFATLHLLLSKRESDSGRRFESSRFQTDMTPKIVLHRWNSRVMDTSRAFSANVCLVGRRVVTVSLALALQRYNCGIKNAI